MFDASLETSVKDFQQGNGLVVDGIVGPATWAALPSHCEASPELEEGSEGPAVAWLQKALARRAGSVHCCLIRHLLCLRIMNVKLKELVLTILQCDGEGSLELLYGNYSAALRHLVGYLSQKDVSDRKALLAVLRKMAFNKHQDVDRPIDEAAIGTEMKNTFRKLLLQELGTTTEEDIDSLYEAIQQGEIK